MMLSRHTNSIHQWIDWLDNMESLLWFIGYRAANTAEIPNRIRNIPSTQVII